MTNIYELPGMKALTGSDSNYLTNADSLSDDAWWNISFVNNSMSINWKGTTRVLGYNENNNSPRIATYKGYTSIIVCPALFKMDGSAVKDNVVTFANEWLKMNDDDYSGDISTPNCAENYGLLKIAYGDLNEAEKNVFQYSDDFSAAQARLTAWATANGETFTYGASEPFASLRKTSTLGENLLGEDKDSTAVILLIVSTIGVSALGAFYLVKKRKRA